MRCVVWLNIKAKTKLMPERRVPDSSSSMTGGRKDQMLKVPRCRPPVVMDERYKENRTLRKTGNRCSYNKNLLGGPSSLIPNISKRPQAASR
jgi:hypothetical protein